MIIKKLEVFRLRCIRKILNIKWNEVMDEKISNKNVLGKFYNLKYTACYLSKRILLFIGRVIRMQNNRAAIRLLSVSIIKIPVVIPINSTRHSFISDIKNMIPFINNQGSFKTLAHIANDELSMP